MIVKSILSEADLVSFLENKFDFFKDYDETLDWLMNLDTDEGNRIALLLRNAEDIYQNIQSRIE